MMRDTFLQRSKESDLCRQGWIRNLHAPNIRTPDDISRGDVSAVALIDPLAFLPVAAFWARLRAIRFRNFLRSSELVAQHGNDFPGAYARYLLSLHSTCFHRSFVEWLSDHHVSIREFTGNDSGCFMKNVLDFSFRFQKHLPFALLKLRPPTRALYASTLERRKF